MTQVAIVGESAVALELHDLCAQAGLSARIVAPGSLDTERYLAGAGWIMEATGFDAATKRRILGGIAACRAPASLVSSDESVASRSELLKGLPAELARNFAVTHMFLPLSRLRLIEFVTQGGAEPGMDAGQQARLRDLLEGPLSRLVIPCADGPGFIANRIGLYVVVAGMGEALHQGIPADAADRILGHALHLPRTGVFGLADLIGLDVTLELAASLQARLPPEDAWNGIKMESLAPLRALILSGRKGRAAGGGTFRRNQASERTEVYDFASQRYRPVDETGASMEYAAFGNLVRERALVYAETVMKETQAEAVCIDRILCEGFGWGKGPLTQKALA